MSTLLYRPSQIITVSTNGNHFKRGKELNDIYPLKDHSIVIDKGKIKKIIENKKVNLSFYENVIDLKNKIVLPGLVECHTHSVFAGSRAQEFYMRMSGKSYEEIAKSGGGINSTVKSVRESSFEELLTISKPRIMKFIEQGVTTLEIKSGYGLSFYDEIKMLEVINELNSIFEIQIIPTFLGAHTFPPEYLNDKNKYIDIITEEMIPFIKEKNLSTSCDGFCEETAFSRLQIEKIFSSAIDAGMNIKLHTDQFNSIGGFELALDMGAMSVDHLEVLNEKYFYNFSESNTVAVLLPGVSFSLKYEYAEAREMIKSNAIVALATDYNPGSSHINNISFIWGLAAFRMGMSIEEIISAYTINSAKALKLSDRIGSIEMGKSADFAIFDAKDSSELLYNVSNNLNVITIKNGKVIYEK